MTWWQDVAELARAGEPFVVVTVVAGRGHVPRPPGSKLLVTAAAARGSIGGGWLEHEAVTRARRLLTEGARAPELATVPLTPAGSGGVQACGGEVTLLWEPVYPRRPAVAVFGAGHVGLALARVLSLLPLELWLVDPRPEMLAAERLRPLAGGRATLVTRLLPRPEEAVGELPVGAHVVVVTHDHELDLAVVSAALGRRDLGFLGMIGSPVKWARFADALRQRGFADADLARVTVPLGLPGVPGRSPEAIAIATAAQLLGHLDPAAID